MKRERQMKDVLSDVRRALRYADRVLPFEGTIGRASEARRIAKAYVAGLKAGRADMKGESR